MSEAERALAALAAAALQPSAGAAAAAAGAVGGAANAPAAPAGVTFTLAERGEVTPVLFLRVVSGLRPACDKNKLSFRGDWLLL